MSLILVGGVVSSATPQHISLTLHPDRVVNQVDLKIYGHFLEHIYHSCNGGLWGELIWNRSFEGSGTPQAWTRSDDCLAQLGGGTNVRLVFGEPSWGDYEFTVEARKTGGAEGFLVILRAADAREFYWANLGGWGNAGHALERGIRGEDRWRAVTRRRTGRIESDRWYQIRSVCQGRRIRVWLDDELIIDYLDDGSGALRGQVGVGTWSTQAKYRNFKVTTLDGEILHEGLPELPEETVDVAPRWRPWGQADISDVTVNALNGQNCKRITTTEGVGGLAQRPLKIEKGETYRGSLWARGNLQGQLSVSLLTDGEMVAEQVVGGISADWKEYPLTLASAVSSDRAELQVVADGRGDVWIDQVSLMPESWRKAGGERPDLLRAIAALRPPVIRWPGGCFASPYRWKDGIGPQHLRKPHPRTMWDDKDVNSFGTDEFIAMCRKVGAEPIIVVNIGTENWNRDVQDNDFLQEALDWIEYCNGPADSTWGKVRAANGHAEPYGVKYWEIDNETWHMGAAAYAAAVNRFGSAMRKADPTITLIACGSGGYDQSWNRTVIEQAGSNFDYISTHHYENPDNYARGPARDEAFYRELKQIIDDGPNPEIKVYCSEWNAQSTDWRTGLYCGGILNVFERCGQFFEIGGPALFLRHVSASAWDNAFINFDHRTWFPAPNYVVMKLWRDHYAPQRIEIRGETGRLNLVATRTAAGDRLYLKAVNPYRDTVDVLVRLDPGTIAQGTLQIVAPGSLEARNELDDPDAVRAVEAEVKQVGDGLRFTMPAFSCGVVTIIPKQATP
jgi:alpha-N-arabinofuranosidase